MDNGFDILGKEVRTEVTLSTLDSVFEAFYDPESFSYQDYEETTAKALVLLANLRIVLTLANGGDDKTLRDACVWWVWMMESNVPKGWDVERLQFLQSTPAWELTKRAIAGEIPFNSLIGSEATENS